MNEHIAGISKSEDCQTIKEPIRVIDKGLDPVYSRGALKISDHDVSVIRSTVSRCFVYGYHIFLVPRTLPVLHFPPDIPVSSVITLLRRSPLPITWSSYFSSEMQKILLHALQYTYQRCGSFCPDPATSRGRHSSMERMNREFMEHIKRNRGDPGLQSRKNGSPDYYGEKVCLPTPLIRSL